jgi:nitrite reductase/ring-hydroxylating ferredoxin subunit
MQYKFKNRLKISFLFLSFLVLLTGCQDDDLIPEVLFNYYIDINSVDYNSLKVPGNAEYLNIAGYRGVIIHCNYVDEYVAFERACPHHPDNADAVVEIDESLNATCPVCGSQFSLYDGTVISGPSERSLKWYNTDLQGSILYVYN